MLAKLSFVFFYLLLTIIIYTVWRFAYGGESLTAFFVLIAALFSLISISK